MDLLIMLTLGIAWTFYTLHITRQNLKMRKEIKILRESVNILSDLLEEEDSRKTRSFTHGL